MITSERVIVICGHYGAGKTNMAVNLALHLRGLGEEVTVADLDLVNPYFRTADFREFFAKEGIELLAPMYAGTNLDIPAVPPRLAAEIENGRGRLIIDVGGDDDGAVALGGYAPRLQEQGYTLYYVINALREPDPDPMAEVELLKSVEAASRLTVTGLVNNTNLGPETTAEVITRSTDYIDAVARESGLPVLFTTASVPLGGEKVFEIKRYVRLPWEVP